MLTLIGMSYESKKNSADKIQSKNYKGGKFALPHAN